MNDPIPYNVFQPAVPAATYRGYKGQLQQWYEENFDPTSGFTARTSYRGIDWDSAVLLRNYFTRYGISAALRNERGISTLTLNDATGNYVIDKWEMSVDREQPSVFENPLFLALINTAADPSTAISMLRGALQNSDPSNAQNSWNGLVQTLQTTSTTDSNGGITIQTTPNSVAANFLNALGAGFYGGFVTDGSFSNANMTKLKQYFYDYSCGVTNFERGKYRLRHTTNAPARWGANIADFNTEQIYTISQLLNEVQSSTLWIYPLPGYLAYKILNYYIPVTRTNYVWGAWKSKSDANSAANNRIEIVTEYTIDQINTNLYTTI